MKTYSVRKSVILILITAIFTVSISGCTRKGWLVLKSEKEKVIEVVNSNAEGGDAEAIIQDLIKESKYFSEIKGGKWKWIITAEGDNIYVADYGYWGRHVWWKIVLGAVISVITYVFTLAVTRGRAAAGYNPWPASCGPGSIRLYLAFRVDTANNTIEFLDRDPHLETTCIDVSVE